MKKKLASTIVLVLLSVFFVNAQDMSTLWSEDFEGDWTSNWYVDNGTWEVGAPTSGPGSAYSGDHCAGTVLGGNYPGNANTRLIRYNSFTVPSADQNPRLRFWQWYNISSSDNATVQIKVADGAWTTISETYTHTGGGIWTYPSIDLSDYADLTVQIAFYFVSDNNGYSVSSGWYIDDLEVITGPIVYNNPEGWELGLGDWYPDKGTWEVGTPTSGPGSAYSGEHCVATVLGGNYHGAVNSRFIGPEFTVPSADQNPRLRFWQWYNISSSDNATVQIKVADGAWTTISETYTHTGGGIWTYPSIDLSDYADLTVQIAFYFVSDNNGYSVSSGWYIDDLEVITGPIVYNNPEGWELGLGDWYPDKGTWEVGTPTSGPGSAYSGEHCVATVLGGNYHGAVNSRFIGPEFTVPSADQNPRLRFWQWYNISSSDNATVQIKVADGAWTTISETYTHTGGGIWTYPSIDLSDYADLTVQIAFYFVSDNNGYSVSSGWYIDDLEVITGPIVYNNPEGWELGLGDWYPDKGTWEVELLRVVRGVHIQENTVLQLFWVEIIMGLSTAGS